MYMVLGNLVKLFKNKSKITNLFFGRNRFLFCCSRIFFFAAAASSSSVVAASSSSIVTFQRQPNLVNIFLH
ncbi:hypothetical protein ACOSQ2_007141 [Xanthoceras sorbifolium]